MLMGFASIAVLGLSFFIIENSRKSTSSIAGLQSFYLAEAGAQESFYSFRQDGYFSLGERELASNQRYTLEGEQSGLLMVNVQNSRIDVISEHQQRYEVSGILAKSATDSLSLRVVGMVITWDIAEARLRWIKIGTDTVWNGNMRSPAVCNIKDTAVDTDGDIITLRYDKADISAIGVQIEFVMEDGSRKTVPAYPPSDISNFIVSSVGTAEMSTLSRTTAIEMEYNEIIEKIVGYRQVP